MTTRASSRILKSKVRFQVPALGWQQIVLWASRRWRGHHPLNASSRALFAFIEYYIWMEHNKRRFGNEISTPGKTARLYLVQIRFTLLGADLRFNVSTAVLFRIWRIPWNTS
ncbi:UNVERIFIED_CONTAM: hypothetical protein Slati_2949700 [Sesamum latifolium]|uniref:Uncharacterized protein n=1 Tax=Sesamum latifolium TaxID=2727402 RepID=A0AAW2VDD8_9LAMI